MQSLLQLCSSKVPNAASPREVTQDCRRGKLKTRACLEGKSSLATCGFFSQQLSDEGAVRKFQMVGTFRGQLGRMGVGDRITAEHLGALSDPSPAPRTRACLVASLESLCLAHEGG